jgi:Tfp pilus assembly protein PilF
MVAAHQGDFAAARAAWGQALGLFREIGDRRSEGAALQNLGSAAASQGNYGESRAMLEQALRCCRETDDRYGESSVLGELGNIARAQGDYGHARDYLTQALHLHSSIGDRERTGWALAYLGLLCHATGEDAAALDYSRQALRIAQELGARRLQARAHTQLGHNQWRAGRLDEAATAYWQALTIQRGLGAHNLAMEPLAGLAKVALDCTDFDQARAYIDEILAYLALITLDGAEEPLRVYLTCYQVLYALHDPRAETLLAKAHRVLHEQADRIDDPALRRSFLEDVSIHRALESAWAAHSCTDEL